MCGNCLATITAGPGKLREAYDEHQKTCRRRQGAPETRQVGVKAGGGASGAGA